MSAAELLAGFEAATLPGLHHRDHVRVAWLYLRRDPLLRASERFSADLRRFALAKGRPGLYHETLTLWNPSVPDRYYRKETLASERARRTFLQPDRLSRSREPRLHGVPLDARRAAGVCGGRGPGRAPNTGPGAS